MHTLTTRLSEHAMRMRGEADAHEAEAAEILAQPKSNWAALDAVNVKKAKDLRAKAATKRAYAKHADEGRFAYNPDDIGRCFEYSGLHGEAAGNSRDVRVDAAGAPLKGYFP